MLSYSDDSRVRFRNTRSAHGSIGPRCINGIAIPFEQLACNGVVEMMKPGDHVLMQFGHNDSESLQGARVSLPGAGDETTEGVHTYGWYLKRFITEMCPAGATPIVCSLVPIKIWEDGKIVRNALDYEKWAAEAPQSGNAPFIDLNGIIAREYDRLGAEKVEDLFADEHNTYEPRRRGAKCRDPREGASRASAHAISEG